MFVPLKLAQALYGAGAYIKNFLYDNRIYSPTKSKCKVISVGNLTVGGAGKTPFTCMLANKLSDRRLAILSRGYGAKHPGGIHIVSDGSVIADPPPASADEPYMMAKKLPGVAVVCAPDRVAGARVITERFDPELIILDDGFQHRAIHRDIDILLFDARTPPDALRLLPLGLLREPLNGMERADLIVITGVNSVDGDVRAEAIECVRKYTNSQTAVLTVDGAVTGYIGLSGERAQAPKGEVFGLCGIANPDQFANTLNNEGLELAGSLDYPDHHQFTGDDVNRINDAAAQSGAKAIVTTEKDMARLELFHDAFNIPVYAVIWEMSVIEGAEELDKLLEKFFKEY